MINKSSKDFPHKALISRSSKTNVNYSNKLAPREACLLYIDSSKLMKFDAIKHRLKMYTIIVSLLMEINSKLEE